ncbi:MAG TPA: thymidine phosphorylase, partial [Longimicrobiaceae bacterium]|nr:thymidine phosphorylase [Longimicrobiaceae bacterium]
MNTLTLPGAPQAAAPPDPAAVRVRRIGIHTYQEPVIYMHADCAVCRSEGFEAEARVRVTCAGRSIEATLNVVTSDLLSTDEAALSESAWLLLAAEEGAWVRLSHPEPLESFAKVRAKLYGATLDESALRAVVRDIAAQRYTAIQVAAFVAACAGGRMNRGEVLGLTRAMVDAGERLAWPRTPVVDKHCVGGLPGNRTTPVVVAIVAACGLLIPKTSSRAITSPAGTADAMETLAPVDLDLERMRAVVEREGGCVVWGGAVRLSPADDVLIRVERPLDLDSEAQLVASVLSKKVAAGSTHVVIDVPVGLTAKVRTAAAADALGGALREVGAALGLWVDVIRTDGSQPVGRGIGPALEARDVVAVLSGAPDAPADLRERAILLSGA